MSPVTRWRLFTVAMLVASACFPSLDDLTGGDGGSDAMTDASFEASADVSASDVGSDTVDAGPCPSLHGPAMVFVPTSSGGFCIDSTEVTTTDYAEFVTAVGLGAPVAAPADGVCQWNTSVVPMNNGSYNCTPDWTDSQMHPNRPIACIDWCDAYAYCAWAGKRMCGAIDGGVLAFASVINPTNQAYVACSKNATQTFPYGSTYVKGNCNTKDLYEGGTPMVGDVGSFTSCVGGFPGLYDMAGNVEEWLDSCNVQNEGGANDNCHENADSFNYVPSQGYAHCDNTDSDYRNLRSWDIGIRCCSP